MVLIGTAGLPRCLLMTCQFRPRALVRRSPVRAAALPDIAESELPRITAAMRALSESRVGYAP
jgi:hypothetical protein